MGSVYLIPTLLHESGIACLPAYLLTAIQKCTVLYVENARTARRFLKTLSKDIVIDDYAWVVMKEVTDDTIGIFTQHIKEGRTIGILSEAGCPGVADPGQILVAVAQALDYAVRPLVGPNSILLALMASGMNGQQFQFVGYLPIDNAERTKTLKALEAESKQKNCTQIFIETPYRNNQLVETITKVCQGNTRLCIAADLTAPGEYVKTKTVQQWKPALPDMHKRPAIFLLYAGN